MSRLKVWGFTAVTGLGLAANFALLAPRLAESADEELRARLASAAAGVRAQIELLDAQLAPRGLGQSADLVEALRAPADSNQAAPPPSERALREAAAVAAPDPELIAVANPQGSIVSRRGTPAVVTDAAGMPPVVRSVLEGGSGAPAFALLDRQLYRVAGAHVPGGPAVVVLGKALDDRFAGQIRGLVDADVSFFAGGTLSGSSLASATTREELTRWQKTSAPGFGNPVGAPLLVRALGLPRGSALFPHRGTVFPLGGGVQGAVTISSAPALAWRARYEAGYLVGLTLFLFAGFLAGFFSPADFAQPPARPQIVAPRARASRSESISEPGDEELVSPPRRVSRSSPPDAPVEASSDPAPRADDVPWQKEEPAWEAKPPAPPPPNDPPEASSSNGSVEASAVNGHAGAEGAHEQPFPGDEPTRVEPISAALLDKLREKDGDEPRPQAPSRLPPSAEPKPRLGAHALEEKPALIPPRPAPSRPPPTRPAPSRSGGAAAAPDLELMTAADGEADEAHYQETFQRFVALREKTGEPSATFTYDKFAARLRKQKQELLAKHGGNVRFVVYVKDGKAAIKAVR